jgi:hypothetical protein
MWIGGTLRNEEFTAVPCFLCCSSTCKVKKDRIKETAIDTRTLPAGVEVTRIFLGGYETAVKIDPPASGTAERVNTLF